MQNIPGIALDRATDQPKVAKINTANSGEQHALFADLFDQHAALVENELAMSPVSTQEKMLDTAPQVVREEAPVNAAGTKAPIKEDPEPAEQDLDKRMTNEEFEEVKDDLEEYGFSEEEIAQIEERVDSEEGMTWGEFTAVIANKVAEMRGFELSDEMKGSLNSFFSKLGFTPKESAGLIKQLEAGEFDKVMNAMAKKIEAMPKDKQMLLDKQEVEAFAVAMSFSKEFTGKLKELLGNNTLTKDVKEAFTLIRQEMARMDKKEQELVRAVGKVFAKSMGDESKESSAARVIAEAVDLKPRVAEEEAKLEAKETFKQAVETRKESVPETNVRKSSEKPLPEKAEVKTDVKPETTEQPQDTEPENNWNNLVGKVQDDTSQAARQFQARTGDAEQALKAGLTDADANTKSKAWEKISAPKVMKQVETAFLKHMQNGTKQLTLQLTPENLGKLNIVLQVQGKEVSAVIRAESPDAAKVIADNIDVIKSSLESEGLKVEKLEVQTGLTNNQDGPDWFGKEQHNMAREREMMIAMRNHMKNMREESGDVAQDLQRIREQAINADQGLYVIA